ncbi:MAG: SRPBCC family protein [Actinomycetes bacterium]
MSAHTVVSITIDQPSGVVFDTVHDYHRRFEWDTMLRTARTIDDATPAKDVVAVCAAKWQFGGLVFATRYVTFRRPTVAAVVLVRPYFVFDRWAASIRHRDLPATGGSGPRSELTYTLTFGCRPRWLAGPLEATAVRLFRRETRRRLVALKRYVEASADLPSPIKLEVGIGQ